jgi:hypothetical protein
MEKYLSFSIGNIVFLDSFQFTISSLESLVEALVKADNAQPGKKLFKNFDNEFLGFQPTLKKLLKQKGVFPYDWYDNTDKLSLKKLPSKHEFRSKLNNEHINEEDYIRAKEVFDLGCTTFYDYLSLYLKTDVLLLADVFESFRDMCLQYYGLDPCHYFTAPGFSWDSMLKMTGAKIECFQEGQEDMLEMVQRGMRGGMSMISTRYARANNKYMKKYKPNLPSSFIEYLDANNLYGWAMSQPLPEGDYKWEDPEQYTVEKIQGLKDDAERGYILEVDLKVPTELHDFFNDYPLAPEQSVSKPSPFMKELGKKLNIAENKVEKLVTSLSDKKNYVLHYRNLKLYLRLGLVLEKVHKVLSFKQSAYLKQYIDFNTEKRKESKNDFEKNLFKLFNNAIFGKTCENVENRIDVKLLTDPKKFVDQCSKPYFKDFKIFNNDLVACEMGKTCVKYDKPMIVGMCVLDLSKVLMYEFHYDFIKKQYGNKAKLLFTDTDSLTYHIETEDFYVDMKNNLELFDTSDYPKGHLCQSDDNKKEIGKFKDEAESVPIVEFVGLRSKMYSFMKEGGKSKATAKGIKKNVIKSLTIHQYRKAIFSNNVKDMKQKTSFNLIRSMNHQLYSINVNKTGLCCYDDKRYVLGDNIHTLAHGHYLAHD